MPSPNMSPISPVSLPSYKKPPINEVVCGLRFNTPGELKIPHIGLLWDKFRTDYPRIEHASPIVSAKGEFLIDPVTGLPLHRVWFINESDDQLIQFQFDRLYFNWRRRQGDYPRYSYVIEHFEKVLNIVENFFIEFNLGDITPIEYELSYINHIPKGEGWNTIDDLSRIFSDFVWVKKAERFLPNPLNFGWKTEFPLPEKMGRLAITLKQAIRTEDRVPLFILELNSRGFLDEATNKKDFHKWFDVAHEWIVKGFTDITTPEIHSIWEREV
ncbi:MAG: TIGR04255 family protein [wastewater metagenome]|nr:TIGR04255 family protein [Candidatus Loosdrechtia aerotolerans]